LNVDIIVGTRPNFMKVAPIIRAIEELPTENRKLSYRLIHTSQHYDFNMSKSFFEQLGIPAPHNNFNISSGSITQQTANIMLEYEKLLKSKVSDLCLVVGDVTSTMACAITAKRFNVRIAHVEGGIRSGDLSMPEEINRILTDSISDIFFTTSKSADENLRKSGISADKIHFVGNTMIDTLMYNIDRLKKPSFWTSFGFEKKNYFVLTLHRPSNVDEVESLLSILERVAKGGRSLPIVFPVHPRTKRSLLNFDLPYSNILLVEPQPYLEFIYLVKNSKAVITDSGGITEEATVLNVPCITLRDSTERPETVTIGTNELVGSDYNKLNIFMHKIFDEEWKSGCVPEKWDGYAAERVVDYLSTL